MKVILKMLSLEILRLEENGGYDDVHKKILGIVLYMRFSPGHLHGLDAHL